MCRLTLRSPRSLFLPDASVIDIGRFVGSLYHDEKGKNQYDMGWVLQFSGITRSLCSPFKGVGPFVFAAIPVSQIQPAPIDDLAQQIVRLMDTVVDPQSDAHIQENLAAVRTFLGDRSAADAQKLVTRVMAKYTHDINRLMALNLVTHAEQLTLRKFACALAFILNAVQGSAGGAAVLPPPSQFGLMPGYTDRHRVTVGDADRPVIVTADGTALVADNSRLLGVGSYGKVKTARSGDRIYAIKRINLNRLASGNHFVVDYLLFLNAAKEVFYAQKLARGSHAILRTDYAWVYEDGKQPRSDSGSRPPGHVTKVGIQMEVAHSDGIMVARSELSVGKKIYFMVGLAAGLADMHRVGLAHQDIKLRNAVLTQDGCVKLADFGSVVPFKVRSDQLFPIEIVGGSNPSPEALKVRRGEQSIADIQFDKVDVFAFGRSLSHMAFYAFSLAGNGRLLRCPEPWELDPQSIIPQLNAVQSIAGPAIATVIGACCQDDPAARPTMQDVYVRLRMICAARVFG